MKETNTEVIKTGMKVGAVLGGLFFLVFGIVPGFHYSGQMVLIFLSKITGGPLDFDLGVRLVVIFGILFGSLCLGAIGIIVGSALGTISGYVVNALSPVGTPQVK